MGLLDSLLQTATGALQSNSGSSGGSALDLIQGLIQGHGGLGGLLDKLREGGLGSQVDSWISTGKNMPVSAQDIIGALGQGQLAQIAQRLGVDPQQAAGHIADALPKAVDHLTPNGQMPAESMIASALELLKGRVSA
jgi:uncharacterized protein YidB (DUF937 family)